MRDRLLPADPVLRDTARRLFDRVEDAPIISPHGHVDPLQLADDRPFENPTELLVTKDHYLTRLLHASGIDLAELGVGDCPADPHAVWRLFAENRHLFAGTATGYWIGEELRTVFGVDRRLTPGTADEIYDAVAAKLAEPEFRPRQLFRRFGIDVLATTDDPLDSLEPHRRLQADGFRVLPTFRPDTYINPESPGFSPRVQRLTEETGEISDFSGYLRALQSRREHFLRSGAVSSDHGTTDPTTLELDASEAENLFRRVRRADAALDDQRRFHAHMLWQMARMSVEDGLVMTLHPGIERNHSTATFRRFGPDTGHDIPVPTDFVRSLRPLLERFGLAPGFHLILFTADETTFSREIAPLAGFYPSVFIGAPWWFLDAPDAIGRFRAAVTETAGFYRGSGFIDDTRAFLSIPARHDSARRADAGFLARLVAEGRLEFPEAERIIDDLVAAIPRQAFKL